MNFGENFGEEMLKIFKKILNNLKKVNESDFTGILVYLRRSLKKVWRYFRNSRTNF